MEKALEVEDSLQASSAERNLKGLKWNQLTTDELMAVLISVEPVSMSFANLRQGLGSARSRYINKGKILEI
eukprot:2963001-Amphidinium_carterae.1